MHYWNWASNQIASPGFWLLPLSILLVSDYGRISFKGEKQNYGVVVERCTSVNHLLSQNQTTKCHSWCGWIPELITFGL